MADLSLSESPLLPPRLGSSSPRGTTSRDWDELSNALLEDGYILTALELYTELLEAGKDVPSLRDYFSNPGNFENAIPQLPSAGLLHSMGERVCWNNYNKSCVIIILYCILILHLIT